jgi:hypothetical protein
MVPSARTINSTTIARRSSFAASEVRSVDKRSGSIGKIAAVVYTLVVLATAWRSMADSRGTVASTSAMATHTFTPPLPSGSAKESWSRSRDSSLSIEHHGSCRRSRTGSSVTSGGPTMPATAAVTSGGKSGSNPCARIDCFAIASSRARCERYPSSVLLMVAMVTDTSRSSPDR